MNKSPTKDRLGYKSFYRRNLPHIQPLDTSLFVTFRLVNSLPSEVLARMAEERRQLERVLRPASPSAESRFRELARRYFKTLESCLDKAANGPTWLADQRVANLVAEALHYRDSKDFRLDCFSIMPNHVHTVFKPLGEEAPSKSLSSIMHSLKRNTAKQANRVLERSGAFWEHESFDHYIRDETERKRIVKYVLENPVKAGLVRHWTEWPWSYLRKAPDAS